MTLSQKIASYRQWELGNYILAIADTDQLRSEIKGCGPEQIKKIKDAANVCWQPQINQFADYSGDRVEVWGVAQGKEVQIRTSSGTMQKIKRGNLRPWLGI